MNRILGNVWMWLRLLAVLSVLAVICSGCSSGITVKRVTDNDESIVGCPWNLSMTQFEVQVTRHVIGCNATDIDINIETTVTPKRVLDNQQRYVLYSNGWWATSDIKSELAPDGSSTGLNAGSDDQTAKVVSNTLGIIKNIATGLSGVSLLRLPTDTLKSAEATKVTNACSEDVRTAVKILYPNGPHGKGTLASVVQAETEALAAITKKVTLYSALAQSDVAYHGNLTAAIENQDANKTKLETDKKQLASALKRTTDVQKVTWPLRSDRFKTSTPFMMDKRAMAKWASSNGTRDKELDKTKVYMALYRQIPARNWVPSPPKAANVIKKGVPVRLATPGRLLICAGGACPESLYPQWNPDKVKNIQAFEQPVLQLGQMYTVPVTGGHFKAEKGVIALDGNGTPSSIQVVEDKAGLVEITNALQEITSLPGQIQKQVTESTRAQVDQLKAESDLAEARAQAVTSEQTSVFNQVKTLNEANLALIQAHQALIKAQAGM